MKNIIVDQEKCIACGACVAMAAKNFDFNDEGLSYVINDEVDENTISAVEACPVAAITIADDCECGCCDGEDCNCGDDCECDNCTCDHDSEEE